jgi:hypothetical protein
VTAAASVGCANSANSTNTTCEPLLPEHARLEAAKKTNGATQLVGEFIDWLDTEKRLVLAERGSIEVYRANVSTQALLAEFFGVSRGALEAEKQALLDHLHNVNEACQWAMTEGKKALQHEDRE